MKTIIYLGAGLPDKDAAAHRILSNSKILRKLGNRVILLGTDTEQKNDTDLIATRTEVQGFEAYSVSYPHSRIEWVKYLFDRNSVKKLCETIDGVDCVILYNHPSMSMLRILKYCHKKKIKVYADVTEWYSASGKGFAFFIIKGLDSFIRMRILHKKLDGLILISTFLYNYYSKCKNIILVPALTDPDEDKWSLDGIVKSKDILKLVYAGNPGRKDKIQLLVEAVSKTKRNVKLDIIGITKERYSKLFQQSQEIINCPNIVFHGKISHRETLNYVKNANYSCFFREDNRMTRAGFPTKLAEAITCGTPIITNKTSDIADYLTENDGYLLDKLELQEIIKCIENAELLKYPNKDTFNYNNYVAQFIELFGRDNDE